MKALIRRLETRLRQLPPHTITVLGLGFVLALGTIDYCFPGPVSFILFYMLVVVFVGWGAGKWHAWLVSAAAVLTILTVHSVLKRGTQQSGLVILWNDSTRFLLFGFVGWLTAETTRLTRDLGRLVEQRTEQWKREAEQHKATAARLTETLERFEQVINNITEVFWLKDFATNQMVYISPAYERVWGRKCEEAYRDPDAWLGAIHPADRAIAAQRAHTEQAAGDYDIEYRIIRPDGAVRWIRGRAFPVRNAQNEVYRIAGLAYDVTDRKKTRAALQKQAAILENMASGVVVSDEQGAIVQMNPAAEQLWGCSRNELLGQSLTVLGVLPVKEAATGFQKAIESLQAGVSRVTTFEHRRKDGVTVWCEAVANRVQAQGETLIVVVTRDVTERVRAQEQLQMQARVLESMAEAVLMVDEQGIIVLTNPAQDALLGYQRGELPGQSIRVMWPYPPDEFQRVFERHRDDLKAHGSTMSEDVARRKDGTLIEVEMRSSIITIGGQAFIVVVGQDITQRKQAEQALRQSEESLRGLLEALPEPAFLADREGKVLVSNPALARSLRVSPGSLKGRYIFDLLPTPIGLFRRARFDEAIRTRKLVRFEDEREGRYFINYMNPVLDRAGNATRVAVFALDFTERKRAEQAIAQKEELYRTLFELSPNGILLQDLSGKILDVNEALCRQSGYSREELLRENTQCLVPAESRPSIEGVLAKLRADQAQELEVESIRKNRERYQVRLSLKPLRLPGGRQAVLVVASDVTETKRAELTREAFLQLGTELNEAGSPLAAGRAIFAAADRLWRWDAAVLQLYSPERDCLDSVLLIDVVNGERREVPAPQHDAPPAPILRRILHAGAELILRTPAEIKQSEFVTFGDAQHLSASLMYVPFRWAGKPVGVLSIQSYVFNAYKPEDLRALQALADYCGGALERIRTAEALREAHDQLEQRVQERTAELQAANAALRQSEGKYRRLHETMTDALVCVDLNGRVTESNRAYQEMLGYTEAELCQLTYTDLTPPKWHAFEAKLLAEQIRLCGYSEVYEKEYRRRDGTVFPVELRVFLVRDDQGQPSGMWAIVRDFTGRKRAEQALREAHDQLEQRVRERTAELETANAALRDSEERYRSLVNNLNVGVYRNTLGPQGRFLQVNPALVRMQGYNSVEDYLTLNVSDTYQDPREREQFLTDLMREGSLANYEVRLKKKDGTPILVSVNATIHHNAGGEADWIDGVLEDITRQKRVQEALRLSENRYRTLAESSPEAIFIFDQTFTIQYVNRAFAAFWKQTPENLTGQTLSQLFPPKTAHYWSKIMSDVFTTAKPVYRDEPIVFPTGESWVEISFIPLQDEAQKVISIMGICRDISERKRTERQLADALDFNQRILEASPMGIAVFKADGRCVFANEALASMVGGPIADILPNNFRRMPTWEKDGLLQMADVALSQVKPVSAEIHGISSFGKGGWAAVHMASFQRETQRHLLAMFYNISDRKRNETLLQLQRDLAVAFSLTSDLDSALKHLLNISMEMGGVDYGGVYLLNPTTGGMDLALSRGGSPQYVKAVSHWTADSPQMQIARRGQLLFVPYHDLPIHLDDIRRAEGLRATAFVPLCHEGKAVGTVVLNSRQNNGIPRQTQIVIEAIAAQAAGAIVRIRAESERAHLQRQILGISDREQARIGQDIHDGLCQRLVSLAFDANSLCHTLGEKHTPAASIARRIARYLDEAITESRQLSRGLFPVRLASEGLPSALEELARTTRSRFKVRCRFTSQGPLKIDDSVIATHLYRIAQEAVTNAIKHSQAKSISIRLRTRASKTELNIEDNGCGISPNQPPKATGLGLHIMDYRARSIGGVLRFGRGRRGGTLVSCCVSHPAGKQSPP